MSKELLRSPEMERLIEVFWLADWYESSLGISQDTSGNWAVLAYKPWGSIVRRDAYDRALDENRISPSLNVVYRKDGNGNIFAMELVPNDGGVYRRKPPKNFEELEPSDAAQWVSDNLKSAARGISVYFGCSLRQKPLNRGAIYILSSTPL